jgi:hypothetical protein
MRSLSRLKMARKFEDFFDVFNLPKMALKNY